MNHSLQFLLDLESVIRERIDNPEAGSYTASLIADGQQRIAQKVGEEAVELALAGAAGDRPEIVDEAADLLYHLLVLLANQDLSVCDVVAALEARHNS